MQKCIFKKNIHKGENNMQNVNIDFNNLMCTRVFSGAKYDLVILHAKGFRA